MYNLHKSSGFSKKPNQVYGGLNPITCKHLETKKVYYRNKDIFHKGKFIYESRGRECKDCGQVFLIEN